jgi:hypothetical protein
MSYALIDDYPTRQFYPRRCTWRWWARGSLGLRALETLALRRKRYKSRSPYLLTRVGTGLERRLVFKLQTPCRPRAHAAVEKTNLLLVQGLVYAFGGEDEDPVVRIGFGYAPALL